MSKQSWFLILAAILLVLIPIVPQMMRVRIAVLRKLRLNWLADLHENNFKGFVLAVRIILFGFALVLAGLSFAR